MTELTREQQDQIISIRQDWMNKYGLCTDPADRPRAEEAIRQAYKDAGRTVPRHIIWAESPYAGALTLALVPAAIDAATDMVKAAVVATLKGEGDKLYDMEMAPLKFNPSDADLWWRHVDYGQHNSDFLSYVDAARQMNLQDVGAVDGVLGVAKTAGWWWPAEEFCIVTERPNELHWDAADELHNESGPAIAFPDGWGLYVWHGTRVPRGLIMGTWSVSDILAERNLEVRRCAIEKIGWETIIIEGRFQQVGTPAADPGNPGHELVLFDMPRELTPEESGGRLLLCDNATPERDGTRRRFGIVVPENTTDPVSAAAWTFGLSAEEYRELKRAC